MRACVLTLLLCAAWPWAGAQSHAPLVALAGRYSHAHAVFLRYGATPEEYVLFWRANVTANTLAVAAVARTTTGFVGVGFAPRGGMLGSIASLCRTLATPVCEERTLDDYLPDQVREDTARPHISDVSFTTVGAFTIAEFTWDVGLPNARYNFSLVTPTRMVFSYSQSNAIEYHGPTNSNDNTITFATGDGARLYTYECNNCVNGACNGFLTCQCEPGWRGTTCVEAVATPTPASLSSLLGSSLADLAERYPFSHTLFLRYGIVTPQEMVVFWKPNQVEQSVAFAAVGRTRGFVGVGFSPSGFMQGSIAAVCRNLAPTPICEERALNGYTASQIILDPQRPHISAGRITIEGAFMVAEFTWNVSLPNAKYNFSLDGSTSMVFSYSLSTAIEYHGTSYSANNHLNLLTGEGSRPFTYDCASCVNGACNGFLTCQCEDGWEGAWCSLPRSTSGPLDLTAAGFTFDLGLTMHWKPLNGTHVTIAVRGTSNGGWVAVGFTDGVYAMVGADAVIGWPASPSGAAKVATYRLNAKRVSGVVEDGALPLSDTYSERVNGVTTIVFTRLLHAPGFIEIKANGDTTVIGAFGSSDGLSKHMEKASKAYNVNFATGAATTIGNDLILVHGVLNFIAWGIAFPFGMLFARYARKLSPPDLWFKCDPYSTITNDVILLVIAFVMVNGAHFATLFHGQLGVALYAMLIFQVVYALLRPHPAPLGTKPPLRRVIFQNVHWWTGRLIVVLIVPQVIKGMILIGWPFWLIITYGVLVGLTLVFVILWELVFQRRIREKALSPPDNERWDLVEEYSIGGLSRTEAALPTEDWTLDAYKLSNQRLHLIGRSSECNLRLDDANVSAKHAVIAFVNSDGIVHPMIADLHSTHGTFVNGEKVTTTLRSLDTGDKVRFGKGSQTMTLTCSGK